MGQHQSVWGIYIQELGKAAEAAESKGDHMCESCGVERNICQLEVMAVKAFGHSVERNGRRQQNMNDKKQRSPNNSNPLIVDKNPSLVQEFNQSLKEREGSFKVPI